MFLGRKKLLPYDYFCHWDVFDSMLRCEFNDLPGEAEGHWRRLRFDGQSGVGGDNWKGSLAAEGVPWN